MNKAQRNHAADLMKQLRGYGFTNRELTFLARRKVPEPTVKRWMRGVTVEDTTEHDKIIAMLGDFALGGNTIKDLDEYKVDRDEVSGIISFKECVKLARNLSAIGTDINGLLKLGEELDNLHLKVPSINANISLNKELGDLGITPKIQGELLEASRRFGDPQRVFEALELYGDIKALEDIKRRLENIVEILEKRESDSKRRKEGYDNEALRQKTYLDIVKLLVSDYSYDYDSLRTLHELAAKYGNPLQVMGAVNAYAGIEQMKIRASAVEVKLKTMEEQVAAAESRLEGLNSLNEAADRKLGEIKAHHEASFRLQMLSDLLTNPRRLQTTPEELARLTLAFLQGVVDNNASYPGGSKFDMLVKSNVQSTINYIQSYLRDSRV